MFGNKLKWKIASRDYYLAEKRNIYIYNLKNVLQKPNKFIYKQNQNVLQIPNTQYLVGLADCISLNSCLDEQHVNQIDYLHYT